MRLRHLVTIGPRPPIGTELHPDADVTFVPMEAIADGLGGLDISQTRPFSEVVSGSYNYFAEGDLLLAKVTPCFENGKKALAQSLSNGIGYATSEVHVIRPGVDRIHPKYLFYLLCSEDFRAGGIASMTGAGGLRRVSDAAVLNYQPSVTNLPTQKAIADFLDRETARIDQLIEKKQRMVEVLEEKRIAAITDLFCGVRAAGCKSFRLRYLLSQPLKYGANEAADSDDPNDVRFIRITDFRSDGTLRKETFKSLPIEKAQEYLLEEGDILFARSGATVGKTFIYEESFGACCFAGYLIRARLNRKKVVPQFVKALTETSEYWNLIGLSNIQATIQNVNAEKYAQLNVPAPSVEAQEKIVGVYKDILSRYKHLKANIDRSADRLREFRSALITAAVTGQIDVSTWSNQGTSDRRLDQIEEATSA